MNWLFDNPLANLPGTEFLMLYAAVITTALVVYGAVKLRLDRTAQLPLPPVPHEPDPFEIAYLRGGANELARSLVFALRQRNFLRITNGEKESWIEQTGVRAARVELKPIERRALEWFATPRQPKELFAAGGLTEELKPFAVTYEARLESSQLLTNDDTRRRLRAWTIAAALVIVGLGGYKLTAALLHGYSNVLFLPIMGIVGVAILFGMSKLPRLTKLGKSYLERLQLAYEKLKYAAAPPARLAEPHPAVAGASFGAVDPTLLMIGVFGATALSGVAYNDYNQAFHKSQQAGASSGSSCGSSCGTSWDSSSGSGGSDGGGSDGGGGGCGGCGGGCS